MVRPTRLATLFCSFVALLGSGALNAGLVRAAHAVPQADFKPCDRISAADVQPFFNAPVKKRAPESNADGSSWNCFFDVIANDGQTLQIAVSNNSAAAMFSGAPPTDDGKPGVALTGIGDMAIREANDVWVYARKGDMFCMIHSDHSYAHAGDFELMRGLKLSDSRGGKIPAATAQILAQALGSLCNRAFGSGNTTPAFGDLT